MAWWRLACIYVESQANARSRADPLVADDALNAVAETMEELGHSRRNSRHCPSGSGDSDGQNYLEMVGNAYLTPPISSSGDWPRVARNSSDGPSIFLRLGES